MKKIDNIVVFGAAEAGSLEQIKVCQRTAYKVALMADNHKGYSVPIGGVVAYKDAISPSGVGFDIACGNKAVLTDADPEDVKKNISKIMDDVFKYISFGVGRSRNRDDFRSPHDHPLFDSERWKIDAVSTLKDIARSQLGTVGSGNHYVDIFIDDLNRIWVGVHFGSRGLGHKIATHFLRAAGAQNGMDVEPCVISTKNTLGQDYLECMSLAGEYAYAGRDWVCSRVASIIGCNIIDEVHNHHNFAWLEEHDGEKLWVVRKGATPAFPGQKGFVGGSMGDISVILEGVDSEDSKAGLYSTVHGAGRVMSRTEAAGKKRWNKGQLDIKSEGLISRDMMKDWINPMGVELRGAGTDESPHCYKRLPDVLAAHEGTIKILHTLHPIGVAMAGENEFDPYKD
jgi:tRNA-splicing ligase RtcB